jgi:hypothetical protein
LGNAFFENRGVFDKYLPNQLIQLNQLFNQKTKFFLFCNKTFILSTRLNH